MPALLETAKMSSKGQLTDPAAVRSLRGVGTGDTVLFVEDKGRIMLLRPDCVELRLRDTFPVHRAETVDGAAVVPAAWDDPEDDVYDALA